MYPHHGAPALQGSKIRDSSNHHSDLLSPLANIDKWTPNIKALSKCPFPTENIRLPFGYRISSIGGSLTSRFERAPLINS
jgi:hypothetical protein